MKINLSKENIAVLVVLFVLTILLSTPIYYQRVSLPVDSDYGSHIRFASEFLQTRELEPATLSHPVLQFMLVFLYWLTRCKLSLYNSMILIQVAFHVFLVFVIYFWFGRAQRKHWDWIRATASLSLTFIAPIVVLAVLDQSFYFGYIGMANYHNPTIHMLKPLALLSMLFAINALEGKKAGIWKILLAAFLMIFATWIKPNYALVILPALVLAGGIRLYKKHELDWKMIFFGFFLPATVNLFFQWLIAYVYGDPGESIILAPFQVEAAFSDWLLLKFFLSAAFPLFILFIARRHLFGQSIHLLIGLAIFIIGITQNYLLAEGGERFLHGNFRWSGQIALFLLFVITMRWLIRELILPGKIKFWQKISAYALYAAHLVGGLAYYIYCMVSTRYG